MNSTIKGKINMDEKDYLEIALRGENAEGKFTKVSYEDYELVARHSWYYRNGYALSTISGKEVRLHRFVMDEHDADVIIDHRNRDRLDNRRENLRRFTRKQNANNTANNRRIMAFGEWKTVAEWAEDPRCGVGYDVLLGRLRKEIEPELALLAGNLHEE